MTELYCFGDDFLKTPPGLAHWRRSPPAQPQFSDAEVLTLALWHGVFAVATLKQTSGLGAQNWRAALPALPVYPQWVTRLPQLLPQIGDLVATPCRHRPSAARLSGLDSKPIPLCQPIRHGRVRVLRDEGADFGKPRKGWCFGFKLPLLRPGAGRVLNIILTLGNWDERVPALALVQGVEGGITLEAWGSRGPECATALAEEAERLLITRDQAPAHRFVLSQVRQRVETTLSQVWWKFGDRIFRRSWRGLWNTLQLKVLYYNLHHAGLVSA